jgi:hypothetical protein
LYLIYIIYQVNQGIDSSSNTIVCPKHNIQLNKPEKSKDSRAFELFLQGKQSVEVAIELDMPADKVEELHVSTGDYQS